MNLPGIKYTDPVEVLRNAAGPSPWYIRAFPPKVEGLVWQDSSEMETNAGVTLLSTVNGDVVALFGMYSYVVTLNERRLLTWHQGYDSKSPGYRNSIDFHCLDVADLIPIKDVRSSLKHLIETREYLLVNAGKESMFAVAADLEPGSHDFNFADEFKFTDELLLWGHCTAKAFRNRWGKNNNLCLFILRPRSGSLEIIPQDWFNNSVQLDFGYQWVTRVARDANTGKIYGEGFRISQFVLDDSLKDVEKWFGDKPYFPRHN